MRKDGSNAKTLDEQEYHVPADGHEQKFSGKIVGWMRQQRYQRDEQQCHGACGDNADDDGFSFDKPGLRDGREQEGADGETEDVGEQQPWHIFNAMQRSG